jgi:hypothetical protein
VEGGGKGGESGEPTAVVEVDNDEEEEEEDKKRQAQNTANGVTLLQRHLVHIDNEAHYQSSTYVPEPFENITAMLVFDDSLKKHNTQLQRRTRDETMVKTNRLLSPIMRIYFSLLHFGTVATACYVSRWLCMSGRLALFVNTATMNQEKPNWREGHLGAKVIAIARDCFLRCSFDVEHPSLSASSASSSSTASASSTTTTTTTTDTLLDTMHIVSQMWICQMNQINLTTDATNQHLLSTPMFILSTHAMSIVLERLFVLNE